jgi:hypothetical protein
MVNTYRGHARRDPPTSVVASLGGVSGGGFGVEPATQPHDVNGERTRRPVVGYPPACIMQPLRRLGTVIDTFR